MVWALRQLVSLNIEHLFYIVNVQLNTRRFEYMTLLCDFCSL